MKQNRGLVAIAALSGAIAVSAGAFAAHGASGKAAEWLRTGSQYHLIHAIAALAVLQLTRGRTVALIFLLGGFLFGGTLYAMAFGAPQWLGAITPLGGGAFIVGWALLALAAWR